MMEVEGDEEKEIEGGEGRGREMGVWRFNVSRIPRSRVLASMVWEEMVGERLKEGGGGEELEGGR